MDNGNSPDNHIGNNRSNLKFTKEPLFPFWDEAQDLFILHWKEIAQSKNAIKLEPDTDKYKQLEKAGVLEVFTARDNGKLVGYGVFITHQHLHYKSSKSADSDLLYLLPSHRNGWAGYRLIKFCFEQLHNISRVQRIFWRMKQHRNFSKLIERLGGKHHEHVYTTVKEI